MAFQFGPRRGRCYEIPDATSGQAPALPPQELEHFEAFDLIYRSLCAMLYNYVPLSGHPGGSISSGRIVAGILFDAMDYDVSRPEREDADLISYAAGHKALGLYAMWALRNELLRIGAPDLLPREERRQLRLEDLLGFRRNPLRPHAARSVKLRGQGARRASHAGHARSSGSRPAPRASAWRPRSAWPSAPATTSAPTRRACTSSRARAA